MPSASAPLSDRPADRPSLGIALILAGMLAISINDVLIKALSDRYPLHQAVFVRSGVGILFSLTILRFEGGLRALRVQRPALHLARGLLIAVSNLAFFAAVAVLPLAEATALFFVAPLFLTLLSIPLLGERVGAVRLAAVAVGFAGVLIMQRPWAGTDSLEVSRVVLLLPVLAAATYALTNILTRKLGADTQASAMAVWLQGTLLTLSILMYLTAGDGRFAAGASNDSLVFLLRAWTWPETTRDYLLFAGLGLNSALVAYALSAAYKVAQAATIAPYEYAGLPLAVFWGWVIFGTLPGLEVWIGIALILGAGLTVFLRERRLGRGPRGRRLARRF